MPKKRGFNNGMRAVYLVAAELEARRWTVAATARNAVGADLLVTGQSCNRAYSIQVKSNAGHANYWLVGQNAKRLASRTHIYVFVNGVTGSEQEYYVVPSAVVKRRVTEDRGDFFAFAKVDADKYKDAWSTLRR
jgi:hypothetical protein